MFQVADGRMTAAAFVAYAYLGPLFDLVGRPAIAHRGYYPDRLIGTLYMTLDGLFGVPLEVAATYIILFSIYGAVLEHSGAGRFFIDWSMAVFGRSRSGAAPRCWAMPRPSPASGSRWRRAWRGCAGDATNPWSTGS